MEIKRRWILVSLLTAAAGFTGISSASAVIFDCNDNVLPASAQENNPNQESGAQGDQDQAMIDGNDNIDLITLNPELAIAIQDEGDADTEGDGTSVSGGERRQSGRAGGDGDVAPQEDSSGTNQDSKARDSSSGTNDDSNAVNEGCLVNADDTLDVITIAPEVSATIDDDPLIFGEDESGSGGNGGAPSPTTGEPGR